MRLPHPRDKFNVVAAFRIPLNLPHAGTLSMRIEYHVRRRLGRIGDEERELLKKTAELQDLLAPCRAERENPAPEEARRVTEQAAALGRSIVGDVERLNLKDDRLGQSIRNLFECLELGEEGAQISLRAGEDPNSALRPT